MKNQDFLDKLDALVKETQQARGMAGAAAGAAEYAMNRTEDAQQEVYVAFKKAISAIDTVLTAAQEAMSTVQEAMKTVEAVTRETDIAAAEAQNFSRQVEAATINAANTAQELSEATRKTRDDRNIWTAERFRELISDERHEAVYKRRGQIESLSELGANLMNVVAKNQWELTYKFKDRNFSFYFGRRLVFGINLHAQISRLCVWVPEDDVIDREDDWIDCGIMNHRPERYYSSSGCAVYPRGVKVADIEEMLAFAYAWWSGGLE